MKKKYPTGKGKTKITVTIDKKINEEFEKYLEDGGLYNKSNVIEKLIRKQIEEDKNKKD